MYTVHIQTILGKMVHITTVIQRKIVSRPLNESEFLFSNTALSAIENRMYREELKESLGMNFFSPFQPESINM